MTEKMPRDPQAQDLYNSILRMEKQKKLDPGEVIDICAQLIELEPDFAPAYIKRSRYLFAGGDCAGALRDLDRAIELGCDDAEAYYRRSQCLANIGNRDEEFLRDIKATLELDPRHAAANAQMGHYYFDKGYKPDAYKYYTAAVNNETNDPMVFLKRALLNMDEGRYEHAIVDLFDSQKCNPHNALVYSLRGDCYYEIGALDRALRDYENACFIDRHSPELYHKIGCVYYDKGDYDNAVKNFGMMVGLAPDAPGGYYSRGIAQMGKEDFAAAVSDLQQAFALAPEAEICYMLSQAYLGMGDKQHGREYYERALQLGFTPEQQE